MGIAGVGAASGHRSLADRVSDFVDPRLGARGNSGRHSHHANAALHAASKAKCDRTPGRWRHRLSRRRIFLLPRASARKIDKSIAVLPFENFSDDKENAYFADGIQDDLLTTLSKIGDLKVISRTSVMQYRGRANNVREIGKALGVSAVLEGSVRRAGNRVRVNVQLIDATNDEHLWADDYDRELTDVFAIQSDLADKIATALRAKLSPAGKAQIERKPTENADAYLAFIQAHGYVTKPDRLPADLLTAEELYQRAVQLDPNFALAHANLSRLESTIYHFSDQHRRAWRKRGLPSKPRAVFNRTCLKPMSRSATFITTAIVITSVRWPNLKSRNEDC